MMKLTYSIDLDQSEKFVEIFILGVLTALKNKAITIDEAEGFIFRPYVAEIFRRNLSENLAELVISGCELEDFVSLGLDVDARINELFSELLDEISKQKELGGWVNKHITVL